MYSTANKRRRSLAPAAAALVEEGQSVLLDSGTTTTAIARALKDMSRLTVITNAINIAAELAGTHIEVILTGGTLRKNSFSLVGPLAEETLRQLSADILFLGVDGFEHQGRSFYAKFVGVRSESSRTMVDIALPDHRRLRLQQIRPSQSVQLIMLPVTSVHEVITDKQLPKIRLECPERRRNKSHTGLI